MLMQKSKMSSLNPHAEPYIPVQLQRPQSSGFLSKSQSSNKKEKGTTDLFVNGSEEEIAASISDGTNDKDEDKEYLMDLIYLTVLFPSAPKQRLLDVYILKNGNLGATIEMLEKGYMAFKRRIQLTEQSTGRLVPSLGCDITGENTSSKQDNISENLDQ